MNQLFGSFDDLLEDSLIEKCFIRSGRCNFRVRLYLLKMLIYEERIFPLESEAEAEILECLPTTEY